MKRCSTCKETKSKSEFHKNKVRKDGLNNQCKACTKKYREENREALRERNRERYEKNTEAIREQQKKYYEENREEILEYQKKYREANREVTRERKKRYQEANREARLEWERGYREANREVTREQGKKYREERQGISRVFATKSGRWSQEEEQFVIDNMHQMTNLQLALALERTESSVVGKIHGMRKKRLIK